jgi:hypothetical protein
MKRLALPLILLAVSIAAHGPGPALASRAKVASTVDPAWYERKINRIAVLDVITPSGADDRVLELEDMIQAALQEQGDFELIFPSDFKAAAERGGARTEYETLDRVWHSRRDIEGPTLKKIGEATSVDAIIGAEVTHFEQYKIDFMQEGNSTTTVGLKIQMFDAKDRKLLWQASMIEVAKSPPYNPSNSIVSDAGGVSRQIGKVPEPPEYDDTAEKVIREVTASFPKAKAEGKKDTKKDIREKKDDNDKKPENAGN